MGVLTYTAKRNVIGGHTAGLSYKIETAFQINDASTKEFGTQRDALGGDVEYELDRIDDLISLKSDVVVESDKLLWKEFTTSVQAREAFTVDLTGTIAAPGTDLNCIIDRNAGFHPNREASGVQVYTFNFVVRLT